MQGQDLEGRALGGGVGCKWIMEQLFMEEYFRFLEFIVGQLQMWKKGTQEVVTGRDPVEPAKKKKKKILH